MVIPALLLGVAALAGGADRTPPFDPVVPRDMTVLRLIGEPPHLVAVRYRRIEVPIWGYRVAALFDNGPRCRGQWQRGIGDGGLSIVNVEFLPREGVLALFPEVSRPIDLALPPRGPMALLPPKDPAVEVLRANLLRAFWGGRPEAADPESVSKNRLAPLPPAPIRRRGGGGRVSRPMRGRVRLPRQQKRLRA